MTTNSTKSAAKDEARKHMRDAFPAGVRVHVLVTNRDEGGANVRVFSANDYGDGIHVTDVSHRIADAIGNRMGKRGIRIGGSGMSPVDQVVSMMGHALYDDQYAFKGVEL